MIVCLGAVASQSLMGRDFRLTKHRGEFLACPFAPNLLATYHPSSILRAPDDENRRARRREFVDDLRLVAERIAG
jgi:DNA polymerase